MADETIFDRPILATPPADNDVVLIRNVDNLADSPQGTDQKQEISVFRTYQDNQVANFNNRVSMGSTATGGGDMRINFLQPNINIIIRSSSTVNLVTISENTGDIDINLGDIRVLNGNVRINSGGIEQRSQSADPVPADIDDGYWELFENTVSSEVAFWFNNGGVMNRSAPLNYAINQSFSPTVIDLGGGATYSIDGANISAWDRNDGNKIHVRIELIDINTTGAPSGELRLANFPFPFATVRSPFTVFEFTGSSVSFTYIVGVIVNNGGNAEMRFTFQTGTADGNLSGGMNAVTLTNANIRVEGFMYF